MDDVHFIVLLEGAQDAFRDGGAADEDFLQVRQFQVVGLQVRQQHQPDGGHGGGDRDLLVGEQFVDRGAVHLRAGHHHVGAGRRARHREAPGIGVEHRHDRQHRVGGAHAHRILAHGDERVEHVGAVGIEHALGVARCAGGVAEAAGGIFREVAPAHILRTPVDPDVEGNRAELVLGHRVGAGIDDEGFDGFELALDGLDDRQEGLVEDEDLVFGVVGDPGDLLRVEARVDRVQDRADAHGAVPGGHVAFGVPAEGRDPVAEDDAGVLEGRGDLLGHGVELRVGGARDVAFDAARDDFAVAVLQARVLEDLVHGQRPVLHNAFHLIFLRFSAARRPGGACDFSMPCLCGQMR